MVKTEDCAIQYAQPSYQHCNRAARSGAPVVLLHTAKYGSGKSYARAAAASGQAKALNFVLLTFACVGEYGKRLDLHGLTEAALVHMYDKLRLLVITMFDFCRLAYSSQIHRLHREEPDSYPWPVNAEMVCW